MISFILNLPYTLIGLLVALVSIPTDIKFRTKPHAFVLHVKKLWWAVGFMKGARAASMGHVVILGPNLEDKDLEHELVHVEQASLEPLIHPFLYYIELVRNGYRNNKYEVEAYQRAGNVYKEK